MRLTCESSTAGLDVIDEIVLEPSLNDYSEEITDSHSYMESPSPIVSDENPLEPSLSSDLDSQDEMDMSTVDEQCLQPLPDHSSEEGEPTIRDANSQNPNRVPSNNESGQASSSQNSLSPSNSSSSSPLVDNSSTSSGATSIQRQSPLHLEARATITVDHLGKLTTQATTQGPTHQLPNT